jgi:beta-lactamase class A
VNIKQAIAAVLCAVTVSGCGFLKADVFPEKEPGKTVEKTAKTPQEPQKPVRDLSAVEKAVQQGSPCSLYFADMETGKVYTRKPQTMSSASMIKVFILARAYEAMADGELKRDESFVLSRDNVVGGSGVLQGLDYGTRVSLARVLETMIVDSDNTATNIMIDRLGMDSINRYMETHGYTHSKLRRKMMDYEAIRAGRDNLTDVQDIGLLFTRLHQGKCVSPELDQEMLAIYKKQKDREILPAGVPAGIEIAHKTGEVNDVRHDGGIVYSPKGAYVLVIFSGNYCAYSRMADISRQVYRAYVESGNPG